MLQVLKLPAYRRLLVASASAMLAWEIVSLALAVLVYRRTGSAIGSAGFFLCSQFAPAFLAPPVVARVDRRAAGRVLPVLLILEAVLLGLLSLLVGRIGVGWVLALVLLDGVIALAIRAVARAATVAVTSPVGLLREGNAAMNTVFTVSVVVGPLIGGLIVGLGSVRAALWAASGVVILVAVSIRTATGLPSAPLHDSPSKGRLLAALKYVRGQPVLRSLLVVQAVGLVFFAMSIPVELVLAQHTLHGGAGGYAALLASWGGGGIVGSIVFARWRSRSTWLFIAFGAGGLGIGFMIMAVSPTLVVAAIGSAVAGAGNGVLPVAARTALQEHSPQQLIALLMSLNDSIWQATPGVGILLGGAVAQLDGPRAALWVGSVGSLVIAVGVSILLRPGAGIMGPAQPVHSAAVEPLTFAAQQRGRYEPSLDDSPASPYAS
jgi:MFS family permease